MIKSWLSRLFGSKDTPTTNSLEEKIEERKKQGYCREITKKAIEVTEELGNTCERPGCYVERPDWYEHVVRLRDKTYENHEIRILNDKKKVLYYHTTFEDDEVSNTAIHICIEIYAGGSKVYEDDSHVYDDRRLCHWGKQVLGKPNDVNGISTYIPGDWEAHLDELYKKALEHRNDQIQRKQECQIKIRQEEEKRRIQETENKKKRFGL